MAGEAADCGGEEKNNGVVFRDIRRYYGEYCGIRRSKKSLIASHVLSRHKEMKIAEEDSEKDLNHKPLGYACEECGATFKKPPYLRQHMQGHSIERGALDSTPKCAEVAFLNGLVSGWVTSCEDPS